MLIPVYHVTHFDVTFKWTQIHLLFQFTIQKRKFSFELEDLLVFFGFDSEEIDAFFTRKTLCYKSCKLLFIATTHCYQSPGNLLAKAHHSKIRFLPKHAALLVLLRVTFLHRGVSLLCFKWYAELKQYKLLPSAITFK